MEVQNIQCQECSKYECKCLIELKNGEVNDYTKELEIIFCNFCKSCECDCDVFIWSGRIKLHDYRDRYGCENTNCVIIPS